MDTKNNKTLDIYITIYRQLSNISVFNDYIILDCFVIFIDIPRKANFWIHSFVDIDKKKTFTKKLTTPLLRRLIFKDKRWSEFKHEPEVDHLIPLDYIEKPLFKNYQDFKKWLEEESELKDMLEDLIRIVSEYEYCNIKVHN